MRFRLRSLLSLLVLASLVAGLGAAPGHAQQFYPQQEPSNSSLVFGCNPGPVEPFIGEDPPLPAHPVPGDDQPPEQAALVVDGEAAGPPIAGSGFNLEHTLWSCPTFRPSLRRRLLEPFRPAIARVDTGQLPFAPDGVPAERLGWEDYQRLMAEPRYQPSWELIRRLNRQQVRVMLAVWGAPGAFTDDGTRRGELLPQYYDQYVEYYAAVVDYLVRQQGLSIWAATVMNEPDGGDGSSLDPDALAEVARRLGPRLAEYGVKLYGPDTASAEDALDYVRPLLDDPEIMTYMAAIATHQYSPSPFVDRLVESVRASPHGVPVYVTEYTSFQFGDLDRGQAADDEVGFMLDIAATLAAHYNAGVDGALYWDAVDYYQGGHAAITRWGLLQGPEEAFFPRKRYFGLLQILPYLQPGARILSTYQRAGDDLTALAIRTPGDDQRDLAIALINQGGPLELELSLQHLPDVDRLEVYLTDDDHDQGHLGHVELDAGHGQVFLPSRSIVTLAPAAAPDEADVRPGGRPPSGS